MSLRVTPETKTALDAAAAISGRSLSQEAEARIDRSFQSGLETAYGPQGAALLTLLGRVIRSAPGGYNLSIEEDWLSDPNAFDRAATGISFALEAMRPPGDPLPAERERSKNMTARLMMMLVETPAHHWVAPLLEGFGKAVAQRLADWNKKYRAALYDEEETAQ